MSDKNTAVGFGDDDEILPVGGVEEIVKLLSGEEPDPFAEVDTASEEGSTEGTDDISVEPTTAQKDEPTTAHEDGKAEDKGKGEQSQTKGEESQKPNTLKFRVKIDKNESDVEISESDLPGLYQKSANYDRMTKRYNESQERLQQMDALAAQLGFESVSEMIESARKTDREGRIKDLVDSGTPTAIAEDYVDRHIEKAVKAAQEKNAPKETEETKPAEGNSDLTEQVNEFFRLRPDLVGKVDKLPDEVVKDVVEKGIPLRVSWAEFEARKTKADLARIMQENETLRQQAETASRAVVRGSQYQRAPDAKVDPFLEGFNSTEDW